MTESTLTFVTQMIYERWVCQWNRLPPQDTWQRAHPKSCPEADLEADIKCDGPCRARGLEND